MWDAAQLIAGAATAVAAMKSRGEAIHLLSHCLLRRYVFHLSTGVVYLKYRRARPAVHPLRSVCVGVHDLQP